MSDIKTVEIRPLSEPPDAVVSVPGSKSDTNRAMLIAALADGPTQLTGALFSDDTRYMSAALQSLGFDVDARSDAGTIGVNGLNGRIPAGSADLFVGNAGTAMRFLTALTALGSGTYRIDGVERMRERPIQPLLDGLSQLGVKAASERNNGCPPVQISSGGVPGGSVKMAGDQSSQYFSALMLIAPCTSSGITIDVEGELVSRLFIDMTAAVMHRFGAEVSHESYRRIHVPGGQIYKPMEYAVEPDASAASYFFAAAAVTGGRVRVEGLGTNSAQGDLKFVDVLETMGCKVVREAWATEVTGPEQLTGIDVDMSPISDTALTLAAIAPFADSPVTMRGLAHTRAQETDRISAPSSELRRLGICVDEFLDRMTIYPGTPIEGVVETYDDHRMAMGFALIGLRVPGIFIANPDCTAKTFPDYFARLSHLRK
ncbi:MAG: 3-phosphoshikimate 1-carboxyvinyltransferase [Candidatus Latescibacteria bacterium]|nr:3-phosphoshikimate 1-carboxyvinyltransferase [Candidatus Latescibacterota bacterium]